MQEFKFTFDRKSSIKNYNQCSVGLFLKNNFRATRGGGITSVVALLQYVL
jgi:hypothetical protein